MCHAMCVFVVLDVCLQVSAYVFAHDISAGHSCDQIDISVFEALLFSDVPHSGSWSLYVCVSACLQAPY